MQIVAILGQPNEPSHTRMKILEIWISKQGIQQTIELYEEHDNSIMECTCFGLAPPSMMSKRVARTTSVKGNAMIRSVMRANIKLDFCLSSLLWKSVTAFNVLMTVPPKPFFSMVFVIKSAPTKRIPSNRVDSCGLWIMRTYKFTKP